MDQLIKHASDDVKATMSALITDLVEESKLSSKTPEGSVKTLKRAKSELPDSYSATIDEYIDYSLMPAAIDAAIKQVREEGMKQEWQNQ